MDDYPKSVCKCGHTGDGPWSQHNDHLMGLAGGHGACKVVGCGCIQFTWTRFVSPNELTPHYLKREYSMREGKR